MAEKSKKLSMRERVKKAEDPKKQARIELEKLHKIEAKGGTVKEEAISWLMRRA